MGSVSTLVLESQVLGAVIGRSDRLHELPGKFGSQVFERPEYRRAFEAIERRAKTKQLPDGPIDIAALCAWAGLGDESILSLSQAETSGVGANPTIAAETLLELHRRRELATLLEKARRALDGDATTDDIAGRIVSRLLDLDQSEAPEVVTTREAILSTIDAVERCKVGKEQVVKTGFAEVDRVLRIRKGNLVVLAARPGVGKTTLALNWADNIALAGGKVLVHSLEMDDAELVTLALARAAGIDSERFFDESGFSSDQWAKIMQAMDERCRDGDGNLLMNTHYPQLGAILRITEKMHRKHGLSLVVVDYLQLVEAQLGKNANREQQVSAVARSLKLMAQRLKVPVLALSQLNREGEKENQAGKNRKSRRDEPQEDKVIPAPQLHHLRESGAIEQDANAVVFLHNPYAESSDPWKREHGPFDLTVRKQRLGKKGRASLTADLQFAQFKSFERTMRDVAQGTPHWQETEGA